MPVCAEKARQQLFLFVVLFARNNEHVAWYVQVVAHLYDVEVFQAFELAHIQAGVGGCRGIDLPLHNGGKIEQPGDFDTDIIFR